MMCGVLSPSMIHRALEVLKESSPWIFALAMVSSALSSLLGRWLLEKSQRRRIAVLAAAAADLRAGNTPSPEKLALILRLYG